jgi:Replication-relaxation
VSPAAVTSLLMKLSERDVAILESVRSHRLLTTNQIQRLHFGPRHATPAAAAGATMRVLSRLDQHNLIARLERRIGGVRAGSSGIVWQLASTGERLLRTMHGEKQRRRYIEPTPVFAAHTLAVSELAVQLHEMHQRGTVEVITIDTEPSCWRSFIGPHGAVEWLKPDLYVITANGEYEDHWFLEADLATEHPPVVVRKAKVYQRYAATGAHQARHGLFPAVTWVVPSSARQRAIQAALSADKAIQPGLFRVVTTDEFVQLIVGGHTETPTPEQPSTSE